MKTISKSQYLNSKQYQISNDSNLKLYCLENEDVEKQKAISKSQCLNPKQAQISNVSNSKLYCLDNLESDTKLWLVKESNDKKYDLEERTFAFAKSVIKFIDRLPKTVANIEISKQVVRSSGSVGANYIEANEALGKKDFLIRIRICRKEAKESCYCLRLLDCNDELEGARKELVKEATELTKIFGAILTKSTNP